MKTFDDKFLVRDMDTAYAGGRVWDLVENDQKSLVRAMRGIAGTIPAGAAHVESLRWLRDGKMRPAFPRAFDISTTRVLQHGPDRWGFFYGGGLNTDGFLEDGPILFGGRTYLTSDGRSIRVETGKAYDVNPSDDDITVMQKGKVFYASGVNPDADPILPGKLIDFFGAPRVVGIRTDRLTDPEGYPGTVVSPVTPEAAGSTITVLGSLQVTTDGDGVPILDESGMITVEGFEDVEVDAYMVLSPFSSWTIDLPDGWVPATLDTDRGILVEGSGFILGDGCIHVFQDPQELWSDGIVRYRVASWRGSHPRSYTLRSSLDPGFGENLSRYRRSSQSPGAFFRACCDVVGLEIADRDKTVSRVEFHGDRSLMTFTDGSSTVVPGRTTRLAGEEIREGSTLSGLLALRSSATHGPDWYKNRPWGLHGVEARLFWPFAAPGILIRDEVVDALSYADPVGGGLRARIKLHGNDDEIEDLWEQLAARERLSGGSWAGDVFGFSTSNEYTRVNALGVVAGILDDRLFAVEGALGSVDAARWRRLLDFISESKPAGSVVIAGSTFFF